MKIGILCNDNFSQGATFFGDSVGTDDREHLQPHLESYKIFKPLTTAPLVSLHLLATLAIEITAIVLACLHPDEQSKCRSYFVLLYIHVSLWFLTLVIIFSNICVHQKVRIYCTEIIF